MGNKKLIDFENLMQQWDYNRNKNIFPERLSIGSNKKVFWICKNGHSFESRVYLMVQSKKGLNCPYCRRQELLPGFNDLETTNLELAKEWNYVRNKGVTPRDVIAGSPKKFWWKCEKGHEWYASMASRSGKNKHGCPYCSHQKVLVGENDLETLYPEIALRFDSKKNNIIPNNILPGSNKKYWWKCEKEHSFYASVSHVVNGRWCPYCAGKKVLMGFNDLMTTHPNLVEEWDYEKNKGLNINYYTRGSSKKVWWKCSKGHSWKTTISSRANGAGCKECLKGLRVSLPEKTIYYYLKKLFSDAQENRRIIESSQMELDIYVPSLNVGIEYDGENWHQDCNNDLKKDELCETVGITLIRIREEKCPIYKSESVKIICKNPHDNIFILKPVINELFKKIAEIKEIKININVNIKRDYEEILNLLETNKKENSLAKLSPQHAAQWHYEKNAVSPYEVSNKSNRVYWWTCEKGHEWQQKVSNKTRAKTPWCPYCKKSKKRLYQ